MNPRARRGARDDAPPNVLFLCHSAKPSGAELALLTLTRHLAPGTTTVLFAEDGPLVARFTAAGVSAKVVGGIRRGGGAARQPSPATALRGLVDLVRYGRRVARWAADREVDVVVARSVKSLLYGAVAARALNVPLVWSVHDRIATDYLGLVPALAVRTLGRVLAQGYVVNSRTTGATIWPGDKPVLVAPPALDRSRVVLKPARPEIAAPVQRVVMVGRISPWKGQHVFLEAFERVFANTDVEAHVVGGALFGEREYEADLHRMVSTGRCAGRIHFTGHLDEVRHHLLGADVLVHASVLPEPFGLVVSEGMATGCAVIATAPGGPAEVIIDGHNGLLVPCGDVDAMVVALQQLHADPELAQRLRTAGRRSVSRYDATVQAAWLQPWLHAVARGVKPARPVTTWSDFALP